MTTTPIPATGKPAAYGGELLRRRDRLARRFVSFTGKRVLDYGCGNGAQTVTFAHDAAMILGCDIMPDGLAELERVTREQGITTIQAQIFDGTTIPAPDASFDLAISFEVLEHVEDECRTLQEIHRVLKADGEFLITVPNKWWVFETHGARLPLLPWNRVPFFSWLPASLHRRWAHARIYRRSQIRRLLEQERFTVLGDAYVTAPMDVLPVPALQRFLRRTIFRADATHVPFLATAIMVHCRKRSGS